MLPWGLPRHGAGHCVSASSRTSAPLFLQVAGDDGTRNRGSVVVLLGRFDGGLPLQGAGPADDQLVLNVRGPRIDAGNPSVVSGFARVRFGTGDGLHNRLLLFLRFDGLTFLLGQFVVS